MIIDLTVNGNPTSLQAQGWESLLRVLRDQLDLPGTKNACEQGECGSCTVIIDGRLICACLVMIADCAGAHVTTVEGLGTSDFPHPVQAAMVEEGAVQCGYCTPGLVVSIAHLLEKEPQPSTEQIREELSGNICRCTGYGAVLRAIDRVVAENDS